jgi:hypothetical protein
LTEPVPLEERRGGTTYFRHVHDSHAASRLVQLLVVTPGDELTAVPLRAKVSALTFKNLRVLYRHR